MRTVQQQGGFTLIEVMIAMAVLGMVLTGVVQMFTATNRSATIQEQMMSLNQDMRAVKNLLVDELRSAGTNPHNLQRIGFQTDSADELNTDANSIHFTRDIDGIDTDGDGTDDDALFMPDGDADDANESIAYYRTNDDCLSGGVGAVLNSGDTTLGCLRRDTGGGGQPLLANVTELQFRYFDASDNELLPATLNATPVLDRISYVDVRLRARVENPARIDAGAQVQEQTFRVFIRNS
ncbi:MAG: hypothetical protein CSA34_03185 [Desulfobulbus propionicus]|nr:MAG: hypothetical protein CSA34_03185 [Desulfobulbus propionicus]